MKPFRAPQDTIGPVDAETAARLVATASDVALVMDRDGIIQDMAVQQSDLSLELEGYGQWFGRAWSDTVSPDSQPKVGKLLREAEANVASGWRQVTHQTMGGRSVPILYAAVKLGGGERIVALGRDLRAVSALQQRLVDAQMSMERDYAKQRFAETRYRLLFQSSSEPVVILDGTSHRVLETNPAAAARLDVGAKRAVGRPLADLFEAPGRPAIQAFLADLRTSGRAEDVEASLTAGRGKFTVSATQFRQETSTLILIRLLPAGGGKAPAAREADGERLAAFVEASPDGFVLTDGSGTILNAQRELHRHGPGRGPRPDARRGARPVARPTRRGLQRHDGEPAPARDHAAVRDHAARRGAARPSTWRLPPPPSDRARARPTASRCATSGRRIAASPRPGHELPRSAEQLTELIGRVPLKDLVRETTDVIEKLCIEAALELTGDNRASAAEVLGLSRQSLYVKLRRFGFADIAEDDA